MPTPLEQCFALHYVGRHDPADAMWWLEHPDQPGPSGCPPAQWTLLAAAEVLDDDGQESAARALLDVLAELLAADREVALRALRSARADAGCLRGGSRLDA